MTKEEETEEAKSESAKAAPNDQAADEIRVHMYESLQRSEDKPGMNPRSILMGYGSRGERVRHTVHDGALRLPASAIEILEMTQADCVRIGGVEPRKTFTLPAIDGVQRPTMDTNLPSVTVTELTAQEVPASMQVDPPGSGPDGQTEHEATPPTDTPRWQTVARNLVVTKPVVNATERIRGGGDDDDVIMATEEAESGAPQATDQARETSSQPSAEPAAHPASQANPTAAPSLEAQQLSSMGSEVATKETTPSAGEAAAASNPAPPPPAGAAAPTTDASTPAEAAVVPPPVPATSTSASTSGAAKETSPPPTVAATAPPVVSSSLSSAKKIAGPAVVPLPSRPRPQWEQHIPGPNDEMPTEPKTPKPSWYDSRKVAELERKMLPEWFDGSANHRNPETYKQTRERIIQISDKVGNRFVTGTLVRRTIPGDVGSLLRLHNFLVTWGFINEEAINDSAPTAAGLHDDAGSGTVSTTVSRASIPSVVWNERSRDELMEAVVDESRKRQKLDDVPIDWDVVAKRVANGASAVDCERVFLSLPLEETSKTERSITPDNTKEESSMQGDKPKSELRENILKEIVDSSRPDVVKAATDAALRATDSLCEAQKAGLLGLVASQAAVQAREEEDTVSRLLVELQEQRLQKLENRLALLDDVEGVLEAERVALELERRDLYTARCRHWFGQ